MEQEPTLVALALHTGLEAPPIVVAERVEVANEEARRPSGRCQTLLLLQHTGTWSLSELSTRSPRFYLPLTLKTLRSTTCFRILQSHIHWLYPSYQSC